MLARLFTVVILCCFYFSSSSHSSSVQKGNVDKFDSANKWEHKSRDRRSTSAAMELLRGYYGLSLESKQTSNNDAVLELKESEDDLPFSPLERPPLTPLFQMGFRIMENPMGQNLHLPSDRAMDML